MMISEIDELQPNIRRTIKREVNRLVNQYDPFGIHLVGSYANGHPGKHSDIGLYVISKDQDWRERGNYFVNGIEIEYFVNPPKQVKAYFQQEDGVRRHTAHMLSTGIILYKVLTIIDELVKLAETHLESIQPMSDTTLQLAKYTLDDGRKDLLDNKSNEDSLEYQLTANRLFQKILDFFFHHHQTVMSKTTLLTNQLDQLDAEFATLIMTSIEHHYAYDVFNELISYTENLLGGKRDETWKLHSSLDL